MWLSELLFLESYRILTLVELPLKMASVVWAKERIRFPSVILIFGRQRLSTVCWILTGVVAVKFRSKDGAKSLGSSSSLPIILPVPQDGSVIISLYCSSYPGGTKSYCLFLSSASGFYSFPFSPTGTDLVQAFIACF